MTLIAERQLPLQFDEIAHPDIPVFDNPAFMDNKSVPVHRWVPWIAGFSSAFVDSVFSSYIPKCLDSCLILDPFAGVGTTLLQAAMRGHQAIGFEINPYASLAAHVKINLLALDINEFDKVVKQISNAALDWRNQEPNRSLIPVRFRSRVPFFSPCVEKQVLNALAFISEIQNKIIRDIFRVAFGSVMVSFSNYTYEPSLSTRSAAGKSFIDDAEVAETLLTKLNQMRSDIQWLQFKAAPANFNKTLIYNDNFFERNNVVDENSVDLMITSPPYLNNYHYARNTRPQLYWLGLISSPEEQKKLEEKNFGTFWQIARTKEKVELNFRHSCLEKILDQLRQLHPEKGAYGGRGWANYAASYFNDCECFLNILKRCLKNNGIGVIVIGNSILQGINIRVQDILGDIGQTSGLTLEGIYKLRSKRVGNSITMSSVRVVTSKAKLDESAVIFRKI